ncbi:hypothetical protein [Bombella mellum]|uniref:hypothetical protein n=1 Tax=Bombella mellum TaxID=2039288 RepID=UPI0015F3AD03|nr:hypothetical protein [Bombella mellum]
MGILFFHGWFAGMDQFETVILQVILANRPALEAPDLTKLVLDRLVAQRALVTLTDKVAQEIGHIDKVTLDQTAKRPPLPYPFKIGKGGFHA